MRESLAFIKSGGINISIALDFCFYGSISPHTAQSCLRQQPDITVQVPNLVKQHASLPDYQPHRSGQSCRSRLCRDFNFEHFSVASINTFIIASTRRDGWCNEMLSTDTGVKCGGLTSPAIDSWRYCFGFGVPRAPLQVRNLSEVCALKWPEPGMSVIAVFIDTRPSGTFGFLSSLRRSWASFSIVF